jgi:hypothetical protein
MDMKQPEVNVRTWKRCAAKDGELAKALAGLGLDATVETDEQGWVNALVITARGRSLRFSEQYSHVIIERPAPSTKKVHVLVGTVFGVKIEEQFDTHALAADRRVLLRGKQDEEEADLRIEEREIDVAITHVNGIGLVPGKEVDDVCF